MKKIIFTILCLFSLNAHAAIKVATDFAPIHSLTAMVMEGVGKPKLIFPSDRDFSHHNLEITSSEIKALRKTDIVFWLGPEMTPNLKKAIAKAAPRAQSIELLKSEGLELLPGEKNPYQDTEVKNDVHVWMNPENAKILLRRISSVLAGRDPKNAGKYTANARKWEKEIDKLKKHVLPVTNNKPLIVTLHDGYPYLFKYLNLKNSHSMGVHAEYIGGPATWQNIQKEMADMKPKCVISDPSLDKNEKTLFKRIKKAKFVELDVMGGKFKPTPAQYIKLMEHTIAAINKCLE